MTGTPSWAHGCRVSGPWPLGAESQMHALLSACHFMIENQDARQEKKKEVESSRFET